VSDCFTAALLLLYCSFAAAAAWRAGEGVRANIAGSISWFAGDLLVLTMCFAAAYCVIYCCFTAAYYMLYGRLAAAY
jgi:hypothetical protein